MTPYYIAYKINGTNHGMVKLSSSRKSCISESIAELEGNEGYYVDCVTETTMEWYEKYQNDPLICDRMITERELKEASLRR